MTRPAAAAGAGRRYAAEPIDTDALKRERPLADVVEASGILLRQGSRGLYWGLCPFHQERTPSFCVDARDPADEHYFCYGACGAHGDVITFVMEHEACSFLEACERLSARGRPATVHRPPAERSRPPGRRWEALEPESSEARVMRLAACVYQERLSQTPHALAYLRRRAVPESLMRDQQLGYADGHALIERLRRECLLDVAEALGLVLARPPEWGTGPPYREFFRHRVVIPELRQGRAIWFIGRTVDDVAGGTAPVDGTRRPKYLSLPGERPLLGLEHVLGQRVAYIVEGPFDWLAALAWGLPAFSICGTHVPPDRLPALSSAVAVYGVFDPDRAGRSAAERFAPVIGSRWRPVRLPDGLDLAELAALGPGGRELFDVTIGRARAAAWLEQTADQP